MKSKFTKSSRNSVKRLVSGLVIALAFGMTGAGAANATLIGDTVHLAHYTGTIGFQQPGSMYTSADLSPNAQNPTVAAGTSDRMNFYWSYPFSYNINVEAASILVDYDTSSAGSATWGDATFAVTGMNDSSGNPLQAVTVETNMAGWDSLTMLSFNNDSVFANWNGLSFAPSTYFNVALDFGQANTSQVPEPSTMLLLGGGLAGFAFWKRKRKV